jgi:hypothetical protein
LSGKKSKTKMKISRSINPLFHCSNIPSFQIVGLS